MRPAYVVQAKESNGRESYISRGYATQAEAVERLSEIVRETPGAFVRRARLFAVDSDGAAWRVVRWC